MTALSEGNDGLSASTTLYSSAYGDGGSDHETSDTFSILTVSEADNETSDTISISTDNTSIFTADDETSDTISISTVTEENSSDGYVSAEDESDTVPVTDQAFNLVTHYCRGYQTYCKGRYCLPHDDSELERWDSTNDIWLSVMDDKLFLAPIQSNPQSILDLGVGTGKWALDVADEYPSALVVGMDLYPKVPLYVPQNLHAIFDNIEHPEWLPVWKTQSIWDFVHLRDTAGSLSDLPALLKKLYDFVNEGGWIEIQEAIFDIELEDKTPDDADPIKKLFAAARRGMRKLGYEPRFAEVILKSLKNAGFINVECVIKRVPISPWKGVPDTKLAEKMQADIESLIGALEAMPLNASDVDETDRIMLPVEARKSLTCQSSRRSRQYCVFLGQKTAITS